MAGVTRFRDGDTTIILDGALEELVTRAVEAAGGEAVRILQARAQTLARAASAQWYAPGTGVKRRTGKSGDIQVVTTVSSTDVRVSVGSTDTALVGSKPRAALIHRPSRASLKAVATSQGEWWRQKRAGLPVGPSGTYGKEDWYVLISNPDASDGKYLIPELIRKPGAALLEAAAPEIAAALQAQLAGGAR